MMALFPCAKSRSKFIHESLRSCFGVSSNGFSRYNPAFSQCHQNPHQRILRSLTRTTFVFLHRTLPLTISLARGIRPDRPPNPLSPIKIQNISSGLSFVWKNSDFILNPWPVQRPTGSTQFLDPFLTS